MARTATTNVEIRGQRIAEGDVVVMRCGSVHRDEDVFGSGPLSIEHPLTDHPLVTQHGNLVVGKTQTAQDLLVVLSEGG